MARSHAAEIRLIGVEGIPEISPGDDLVAVIASALDTQELSLEDGDILVVMSKIVSKAEGRVIAATDREEAIARETVRLVASRAYPGGVTRIVENRQGIVQAAAGVDASNTPDGTALLLPEDRMRRRGLFARACVRHPVLVSASSSPTRSAGRGARARSMRRSARPV